MDIFIDHCINGNIDDIKKMSLKDCDLNDGFVRACRYGHYDIVKYLVELYKTGNPNYKMINIHYRNEDGFTWACTNGHYDIVLYLVELYKNDDNYDKININARDEGGFRWACYSGNYDIVKYLVELHQNDKMWNLNNDITDVNNDITDVNNYRKINIHIWNEDGFRYACMNGHYEVVKYLVELYKTGNPDNMINIHVNNEEGFIWACYNRRYNIVKYLMTLYKNNKFINTNQYKPFNNYLVVFNKFDKYKL